jgi:2-succinyl-5-enolpyruvyl-6-hydroxy-3-cyclohexene-1-carboxylate synthase
LEFVLTTIDRAVFAARRSPSGPVHINCAYREPLILVDGAREPQDGHLHAWRNSNRPYTSYIENAPEIDEEQVSALAELLAEKPNVFIVFGQDESGPNSGEPYAHRSLLRDRPIFYDVAAQVSAGEETSSEELPIECFDLMLLSPAFKNLCQPDAVIHFGGPVVSKRLHEHLASVRPAIYVRISEHGGRRDPSHRVTHRFQCSPDVFLRAWNAAGLEDTSDWVLRLGIASFRAQKAVWDVLMHERGLSEIEVMMELGNAVREVPNARIFAGSSMPIRYMDMYGRLNYASVPVITNRGASGIDGNIATAAGYSMASGQHVVAVIGDLAALHDLNSLALLNQEGVRVTLVILNNDGGGIFHFLPIAEHGDVFEKYFATPHGMHFEDAARMFGLPYARPTTKDEFVEAFTKARESGGSSIIEVVTDREENVRLHRKIGDAVVKALEDL